MAETRRDQSASLGQFDFDLTREPAAVTGQLEYESTFTAPTEWVPYVYSADDLRQTATPRGFSIAAIVFGIVGLLLSLVSVWGGPFAFVAVVLGLFARSREQLVRGLWGYGLALGLVGLALTGIWISVVSDGLAALQL